MYFDILFLVETRFKNIFIILPSSRYYNIYLTPHYDVNTKFKNILVFKNVYLFLLKLYTFIYYTIYIL